MTYKVQVDDVVRNATKEEAAIIDAGRVEQAAREAEAEAKAASKAALLNRLGITAEEAASLLA
jgi:hypothetical protein